MDFFKSVFTDPSPPSSPTSPNPRDSSWNFGSALFQTLASRSESLLDNYAKDFHDFSAGLRNETSVIREVASRAVQGLPGRLESGAAIAQESLEAVGQAIDDVGLTVSGIIAKDLNFANLRLDESGGEDSGSDLNSSENVKPYSRLEAMIHGLQGDVRTYCHEVEESGYSEWKDGFSVEEKREEIERLMEENGVIRGIYHDVVPGEVDEEVFWCRYFYRVDKIVKAEEARARIVKRAISGEEEEELSWDVEDDSDEEIVGGEGKGKGVEDDILVDEENLEGRLISNDKEGSDGKIGSDISIISSQRSSHAEDDIGWDRIEDVRSGDESKVGESDTRKQLDSPEDDELLTWDIEDDD